MTIASGVPAAMTSPPPSPPSGPKSITQSAVLMTSRLCSITTTELPWLTQLVQHFQQLGDVMEVQAGGRFVEDVQGAAGRALRQFLGELDALRLATRQRVCLLADLDVAEADVEQRLQLVAYGRHRREELARLPRPSCRSTSRCRLALDRHVQRLAVVALAVADVAGDVDVRQEVHLDLDDAVALAGLAAAAFDVEGETARLSSRALSPPAGRANQSRIGVNAPV